MYSTTILALLFANIYVTVCFNDSPTTATSGRQEDELNFGHGGYVYLSSDSGSRARAYTKCQYYDVNVTSCSLMNKTVKTTQEIILIRAWLAVTFRDNIATIFSYLLHLPNDTFTNELYTSLNLLYHEIQKNNIKTMDLIVRLKPISNVNILHQLTMLFKSLQTTVPTYCRNALDNVSRMFFKRKDKLKNILSNAKQDGIDLFAGVPIDLLSVLRFKIASKSPGKLETFHGREYVIFFSNIVEGKISLSQPILAVLLLNTRFNHLPPQAMEDLRYIADVLRQNKIENWLLGANFVANITEPYDLIRKAFVSLKESSAINQTLKEIINNFLTFAVKPLSTEEQPYYEKMKPFLRTSFNVSLFFQKLAEDVHIPDALIVKKLADDGKTSIALKDFIPHYYDTPEALQLAFLQRIRNRVSIPKSDHQALMNVINFLKRKERETKPMSRKIKRQIFEPNFMLPSSILDATITIYGKLNDLLNKTTNGTFLGSNNCIVNSTKIVFPRGSLEEAADTESAMEMIRNASTILGMFLNEKFFSETVWSVKKENSPGKLDDAPGRKAQNQKVPMANVNDSNHQNSSNDTTKNFGFDNQKHKTTKREQMIKILKSMLDLKEVKARPLVFYEVLRLYCILVHGPNNHFTNFDLDDSDSKIISGSLIGNNSLTVSRILNDAEFIKNLSTILFEEYDTKQLFLVALFKKMLTLQSVQQDFALFNEVARLLRSIIPLPIDLSDLTNVIQITSLDDAQSVQIIDDFLSARDTIMNLGDDFDVGLYRTKGILLYAILQKSLNVSRDNTIVNRIIRKILPKIDCLTTGSEKVKGIENVNTAEMVDFKKLIKYGLDRQNMSSEVVGAFLNMTNWQSVFDPLKSVNEMQVSLYNTRADFISGFLDILLKNIERKTSEMKRDIELMKTAVKKTGTGLEPVDYL